MDQITRRDFTKTTAAASLSAALGTAWTATGLAEEFISTWPPGVTRVWIGPEYWANRLQDWRIHDGRLECVQGNAAWPMRTVHLLTRRLKAGDGDVQLSVQIGRLDAESGPIATDAAVGFLLGAGGSRMEYRAAALIHNSPGPGGGLFAGIDGSGQAFFRSFETPGEAGSQKGAQAQGGGLPNDVTLRLVGTIADGKYKLVLSAHDPRTGRQLSQAARQGVDPSQLVGNLALVSHPGTGQSTARFWFRDWKVAGTKNEEHNNRLCGPILCTQYTVHNNILKLTAQLMPLGRHPVPCRL
jgi:alkaline phosphatase D